MIEFNAKEEVLKIINFIRDYYDKNNLKGVVIGLSGGKDSAVVAGLFTKALGCENVVGVFIPCHSQNSDKKDAKIVADNFNISFLELDLTKTFDTFKEEIKLFNELDLENCDINLKPRLRMSGLYYIASMLSNKYKKTYLVAGCGNKSEKYVGYTTKYGDNASDIEVISDFFVSEVIMLGKEVGVPENILYKTPADGLSDKSDEEKLGFTYQEIENVCRNNKVNLKTKDRILKMHENNIHKSKIVRYER